MKRFAPAALLLWGFTPVLAHAHEIPAVTQGAEDREQWITIGADTEEPVLEVLRRSGWEPLPETMAKKNAVEKRREAPDLLFVRRQVPQQPPEYTHTGKKGHRQILRRCGEHRWQGDQYT